MFSRVSRVRCATGGFVHETEMSHSGHRRRGAERAPGAGSENAGGISVAALQQVDWGRNPQELWLSGPGTPAPAGNGTENGLAAQGAQVSDFRARSQEAARIADSRGRRTGNFGQFAICRALSDFPANFRRVSGGVRCPMMGHKCLIVRHDKQLKRTAFWAWAKRRRFSGSFMGHLCLIVSCGQASADPLGRRWAGGAPAAVSARR
jgi:hypothetical protein